MSIKWFTWIEVFLVIGSVAMLAAIAIQAMTGRGVRSALNKESAEISMGGYINTLYPELYSLSVLCSNKDSDFNGYLRCSGTGLNSNNLRQSIIAECDAESCSSIQNIDR